MLKYIGVLLLGLVVGGVCGVLWGQRGVNAPKFETTFQAVLLDSGQVYYAKVEGLGTAFPILRDVYYVQSATDPQTKQVTNVLIRRGNEWHGPQMTVINARHLVMIEPIGPNSKVAQLIAAKEQEK